MKDKCPDCGAGIGQAHQRACDVERCSKCGCQRVSCDCDGHDPLKSIWTGERPRRKYVIDCGYPAVAEWRIVPAEEATRFVFNDEQMSFAHAKRTLIDALDAEVRNAEASRKVLLACTSFDEYSVAVSERDFM